MHRARWARAVFFPLICLFFLSVFTSGCAELLYSELVKAEATVASGKTFKGKTGVNENVATPDIVARHKLVLAMNTLLKNDPPYGEVKQVLRSVYKDPYLYHEIKTEAGYLLTVVDKLEARQKELDQLRPRYERCLNEKEEISREKDTTKEKDALIEGLIKERDDLAFKLKKLEEISAQTERRRGNRR